MKTTGEMMKFAEVLPVRRLVSLYHSYVRVDGVEVKVVVQV